MAIISDFGVGILLSLACSVLFGSHTSFAKMKRVISSNVAMPIYNAYFISGLSITCFVVYFIVAGLGKTVEFTYQGFVFAMIILFSEFFLLLSIQQVGVAYSLGFTVFSGSITAVVIQIVLGQPIANGWLLFIALFVLASSIFCMSISKTLLTKFGCLSPSPSTSTVTTEVMEVEVTVNVDINSDGDTDADENAPLLVDVLEMDDIPANPATENVISTRQMLLGMLYSSICGVFFFAGPLPFVLAGENSSGLLFFLSAGIGTLVAIPFSASMVLLSHSFENGSYSTYAQLFTGLVSFDDELWRVREAFLPGLCSGIVWGIGNVAGLCAFLYLDFVVASSVMQLSIIVTVLFGIFVFKEIQTAVEIGTLLLLSIILVASASLVCIASYGAFGV